MAPSTGEALESCWLVGTLGTEGDMERRSAGRCDRARGQPGRVDLEGPSLGGLRSSGQGHRRPGSTPRGRQEHGKAAGLDCGGGRFGMRGGCRHGRE